MDIDLYHQISVLFGSQEYVTLWRELILMMDKLQNDVQLISTGSFAEGLAFPQSDCDVMSCLSSHEIVENARKAFDRRALLMVPSSPGYCFLLDLTNRVSQNLVRLIEDMPVFSSKLLKEKDLEEGLFIHGPAVTKSVGPLDFDGVICIRCSFWPDIGNEWISRRRVNGWPTPEMIEEIISMGCHVVPVGNHRINRSHISTLLSENERSLILSRYLPHKQCQEVIYERNCTLGDHEWRLSFSLAERYLMHSLNHTQFLVYSLLRLALKRVIEKKIPNVLCSYFMKTILFYTIEKTEEKIWCGDGLTECYRICLSALLEAIDAMCCPNYFVAKYNMFQHKIEALDEHKSDALQSTIKDLKEIGVYGLLLNEEPKCLAFDFHDRHIEMELDTEFLTSALIPMVFTVISRHIQNYGLLFQLQNNYSLNKIKDMITENAVFKQNGFQDVLIVMAVTSSCKLLMDQLHKFPTRSDMNKRIRQNIETLLQDLREGDKTTKTLTFASYMYLIGKTKSASSVLQTLLSEWPPYTICTDLLKNEKKKYMEAMCGKGYTLGFKAREAWTPSYHLNVNYLNAAPFPLRLWIASTGFLQIHPLTYAAFLLGICNMSIERNPGVNYLILQRVNSKNKSIIMDIDMCIGILYSMLGNDIMAFIFFRSVHEIHQEGVWSIKETDYSLASLMYIAVIVFKRLKFSNCSTSVQA